MVGCTAYSRKGHISIIPLSNLTSLRVPQPRYPVGLIIRDNFSNETINKGYILLFFIAHMRNGRISTSGLKSDVTIVFLDPDFLYDSKISAIRVHLRQI